MPSCCALQPPGWRVPSRVFTPSVPSLFAASSSALLVRDGGRAGDRVRVIRIRTRARAGARAKGVGLGLGLGLGLGEGKVSARARARARVGKGYLRWAGSRLT